MRVRNCVAATAATALVTLGGGLPLAAAADQPEPSTTPVVLDYTSQKGSALGAAVAQGSCDVTGDGVSDTLTSAWMWDRSGLTGSDVESTGAVYVIPGSPQRHPGHLDDPATDAIRIEGPTDAMLVGFSIDCAGDVNGDAVDDIVIGDYISSRAFVVFGGTSLDTFSLEFLGTRGYVIEGDDDRLGFAVRGVGDLDGDSKADLALVANGYTSEAGRVGRVTIVRGQDRYTTVHLATDADAVLATYTGTPGNQPSSVAAIGDATGDGKSDLAIGAYVATSPGGSPAAGRVWVLDATARGDVELSTQGPGLVIHGPERGRDRLGVSLAAVGDLNGDGLADLAVGADGVPHKQTGPRPGAVAIVHGAASGQVCLDPTSGVTDCASGERRGVLVNGVADGDSTGYAIAGYSAQGVTRLAIGAYNADAPASGEDASPLSGAGTLTVLDPRSLEQAAAVVNLADIHSGALWGQPDPTVQVTSGPVAGARLGRAVALAGTQPVDASRAALVVAVGADGPIGRSPQSRPLTRLLEVSGTSQPLAAPEETTGSHPDADHATDTQAGSPTSEQAPTSTTSEQAATPTGTTTTAPVSGSRPASLLARTGASPLVLGAGLAAAIALALGAALISTRQRKGTER